MIKYCPNCKAELVDKNYLAQHVKECSECKARYFTIETTAPKTFTVALKSNFYCGAYIRRMAAIKIDAGEFGPMGGGAGIDCWDNDKSRKTCAVCGFPLK